MFEVNDYFDGKVKSVAFDVAGQRATLGVMAAGDFAFSTSQKENMKVVSGVMQIKLVGEENFTKYAEGEAFDLEAGINFSVKITETTAYICKYS